MPFIFFCPALQAIKELTLVLMRDLPTDPSPLLHLSHRHMEYLHYKSDGVVPLSITNEFYVIDFPVIFLNIYHVLRVETFRIFRIEKHQEPRSPFAEPPLTLLSLAHQIETATVLEARLVLTIELIFWVAMTLLSPPTPTEPNAMLRQSEQNTCPIDVAGRVLQGYTPTNPLY